MKESKRPRWGRRRFLGLGALLFGAIIAGGVIPSLRAVEEDPVEFPRVVYRATSKFNGNIRVVEDESHRYLMFGPSQQSGQNRRNLNRSAFRYVDGFHLGLAAVPEAKSALFIGLGGGLGPRQFHAFYPRMKIDAVEIDPIVARIARRYFRLPADSRMKVTVGDGRAFLQKTDKKYDLILLDAYDAKSAPPMLTTVEFMRLVKSRLNPGGALVANVIAAQRGPRSRFGRSEYKTLLNVFSDVKVFPVQSSLNPNEDPTDYENLIYVAKNGGELPTRTVWARRSKRLARSEIRELGRIAEKGPLASWPTEDVDVLTDKNPPQEDLFGY